MSEWHKIKLGLLCNLAYGKNLATNLFKSDGFDVFGANGVIGKYDNYTHSETEVLVSSRGENSGVINLSNPKSYITNNSIVCCLKKDIDKKFLYYSLKTVPRKSFISGSAQPQVVIQDLEKIEILLPKDKPEQTRIAEILSTADEVIAHTEALIAKYLRIKTGLMQDLLTKGIDENGNIRSKANHKFVVKNGIEVPEEWVVDTIGNVNNVTKLAGYEFTKYFDYSIGGEIIALRALNIKNEAIILEDIQTIPKKVSDQLPRSKIYSGDVLITYIGAYIGDVLMIEEDDKYHLAPNIAKISVGKKLIPEFLEIVLRTYTIQKQIKNLTAVTATPSLTMQQIRNIIIPFPNEKTEQERIVQKVHSINEDIRNEKLKYAKYQSLKTGLMQDLLSGKVRVNMDNNLLRYGTKN